MSRIEITPSRNGTAHRRSPAPPPASKPAKPARSTKADREARQRNARLRRQLACAVGGVGVGVLGLSVAHCTDAITSLTGSHWTLSGLLALGIDAGMVGAELAELVAGEDRQLRRWALGYVVLAVILSMGLNAFAFASHCPKGMQWAGVVLGVVVPSLVFILGRVAGLLAKGGER